MADKVQTRNNVLRKVSMLVNKFLTGSKENRAFGLPMFVIDHLALQNLFLTVMQLYVLLFPGMEHINL